MATPSGSLNLQGYQPVAQQENQPPQNPPRTCCKKVASVAAVVLVSAITIAEFGYGSFKIYQGTIPDYPYKGISTGLGVAFILAGIASAALGLCTWRKI